MRRFQCLLQFNRKINLTSKQFDIKNEQTSGSGEKAFRPPRHRTDLLFTKKLLDSALFLFLAFAGYISYKRYKAIKNDESKFEIQYVDDEFFKKKLIKTNLGPYILPEFLKKHISSFKSIELKNDDIWIVSFPKSGTTWVQEIVYLIVNNCDFVKAKSKSIETRMPFIDYPNPGFNAIMKLESPRIIKTHLPKPFLPDDIEKKCKV